MSPLGKARQVTVAWWWSLSARELSLLPPAVVEGPLRALSKAQDVMPCCGALRQVKGQDMILAFGNGLPWVERLGCGSGSMPCNASVQASLQFLPSAS